MSRGMAQLIIKAIKNEKLTVVCVFNVNGL
jgi:hypothetical protein